MSIKVVDKAYLSEQFKRYHGVIDPRITNVEGAIATLNGDVNTEGSIQNTVNSAIAGVIDAAPEAFDTLKEISDWIGDHGNTALEMNAAIQSNSSSIETLNGDVSTPGSVDYKIANAVENMEIETENIDFVTLLRETISISGNDTVEVGKDITLTSTVAGVTWVSSDDGKATVVDGVVHGVSEGEVTITASKSGYNAGTKTVTVVAAQEEDVPVIIDGEASVEVGKDITLTSNAENTVWESSNNDIATVNNGVVHGVSKGEVTITATAEGYSPGTKAINVTVVSE